MARRKNPAADFSTRVIEWQRSHGRRGMPWQDTRDAYRVWLSEVMLQQTSVAAVTSYYVRFLERLPTVAALAEAPEDDVMALWSGLGYYARARNLHRAAREVRDRFGGAFPTSFDALVTLPGVGRSTAGAIAAFSSGERRAILDANVRRVLARHAGIAGEPSSAAVNTALWAAAQSRLPHSDIERYTQGMMDLGASLCLPRNPLCLVCPVSADCVARLEKRIDELPTKRTRAAPRRRRIGMLVVMCKGEVLLEKRPPKGIWGGLWSLPEIDADAQPGAALHDAWGLRASRVEALEPFEHVFTHFTLEVAPWKVQVRGANRLGEGKSATWVPLEDLAGAALPAPVRRLLRSVSAASGSDAGSRGAAPDR